MGRIRKASAEAHRARILAEREERAAALAEANEKAIAEKAKRTKSKVSPV